MSQLLFLRSLGAALCTCVALAACSEDPVASNRPDCPDAGVALSVGAGAAPTFSWTPQCQVSALRIQTAAGDTVFWLVGRDDERLDSPIQYGLVPSGAVETVPPRPLIAGRSYNAILIQQVGIGRVLATQPFTP